MQKKLSYYMMALLLLMPFLYACNNDDETVEPLDSPVEIFGIRMFVTNDAGEDLISDSDKYYRTVDRFRFDSWKIYLDGNLIQTGDNDNKYFDREVNHLEVPEPEIKNIRLSSNLEIQKRIEDYSEMHVAEYVVSSASLFGDSEEHTIRMEFQKVNNEYGYLSLTKCNISVDNVKMEVYYPISYGGLCTESPFDYVIEPYFILNIDEL